MIKTEVQLQGDLTADLDKFERDIQEKVAMSGVASMAYVLYEEAKLRAPVKDGTLRDSIYRVFAKEKSSDTRKTYEISWNKAKAPHGHLVEYGHWQTHQIIKLKSGAWVTLKNRKLATPIWTPAKPFMRPAFDRIREAIDVGMKRMKLRLNELEGES